MDLTPLTPQFFLDKFMEFGRAIERVTNLVEKQNERIDDLEQRIEKAAEDHDKEIAEQQGARTERRRFIIGTFYEMLKGVAGAIVGAAAVLWLEHMTHTPLHLP